MKCPKLELGSPDPKPLCFTWFSLFSESRLQLSLKNYGWGVQRGRNKRIIKVNVMSQFLFLLIIVYIGLYFVCSDIL